MDVEALKTALLVARHGSFAGAARVMAVDPSSVSRIVAALEDDLGLRLFQRTTRRLSITEEGDAYLTRIGPLLEEMELARDAATRHGASPSGRLRITASVAFAHECILPHLGAFQAACPDLTVELLTTDATEDLIARNIDLAFRLSPAPKGDLISSRVMQTRYRVVAAPDWMRSHTSSDPVQLADMDCLRFALPGFRDSWRFRDASAGILDVSVGGRVLLSNALSLRKAARDGLGPALLANWMVGQDLRSGRLVDLFPNHDVTATTFDTGAWALYPSRAYLPKKVRAAIDFFRPRFADID